MTASGRMTTRPDPKFLRLRHAIKTGFRHEQGSPVQVIFLVRNTPEGCDPYELVIEASNWEKICFYASNLTVYYLVIGIGAGIVLLLAGT